MYKLLSNANKIIDLHDPNVTLQNIYLDVNSDVESIKQQSVLYKKYLGNGDDGFKLARYLLIHVYSIASGNDLKIRNEYIQKCIESCGKQIFQEQTEKFSAVLHTCINTFETNLPFDKNWLQLPDTDRNRFNRIFILFYFTVNKLMNNYYDSRTSKKNKTILLLTFLKAIRENKSDTKIDDMLERNLLIFFDLFDDFLLIALNSEQLSLSDTEVVEVLSLIKWRFVLYRQTLVNIKNISLADYRSIFSHLHVHYKWFWKYSVQEISNILKMKIGDSFIVPIETTSVLKKLAKHYQKQDVRPPPSTNSMHLEMRKTLKKITDYYNLCCSQNNSKVIINILNNEREVRRTLLQIKANFEFDLPEDSELPVQLQDFVQKHETILKNVQDGRECIKIKESLIPILDFFARLIHLKFKCGFAMNIESLSAVENNLCTPPSLAGAMKQFVNTRDKRLLHEIKSDTFYYLLNAASIVPSRFLNNGEIEGAEQILCVHAPSIAYLLCQLLVCSSDQNNSTVVTTLGNYRNTQDQHQALKLLLWKNCKQLSNKEHDYL